MRKRLALRLDPLMLVIPPHTLMFTTVFSADPSLHKSESPTNLQHDQADLCKEGGGMSYSIVGAFHAGLGFQAVEAGCSVRPVRKGRIRKNTRGRG